MAEIYDPQLNISLNPLGDKLYTIPVIFRVLKYETICRIANASISRIHATIT
jgi:hypothetical protein